MPLVKRPSVKDSEDLQDFICPMPREFVDAFSTLQTDIAAFRDTLPDGTYIEPIEIKLQAANRQALLSYARQLMKEEDFEFSPEIRAYLAKYQTKPRLTPKQKEIEALKDKARAAHAAGRKLQSEGAPEEKIQAKMKAYDKLRARIEKLEPEAATA